MLLHLTSLPSKWGVGDLGPGASRFLELLDASHQSIWQVLPLTPVSEHGSPYSPQSLFAGNPLLLSPEKLVDGGYLPGLPEAPPQGDQKAVDYPAAIQFKARMVDIAFRHSFEKTRKEREYLEFCERNISWLEDFAMYQALRKATGTPWFLWSEDVRDRDPSTLGAKRSSLLQEVELVYFSQYIFDQQWSSLSEEARSMGISIMGDMPFYVLLDSADIWAHRTLFKIDAGGQPLFVGGVPPDYFSKTGQRWGNPVYDWGKLEETGYRWWKERVVRDLKLTDLLRLDHFRGYVACWEIPAHEETAINGKWVSIPESFLPWVKATFPTLPFVAEDLGVITDDVKTAMGRLGVPGMKVLQFAFDGKADNPYLPRNHPRESLVCTGTHDTNTTMGWFRDEAGTVQRRAIADYLEKEVDETNVCDVFVTSAMNSVANLCITPMQDILRLGSEARMNNPAVSYGNWKWRLLPDELGPKPFDLLAGLTPSSGRS